MAQAALAQKVQLTFPFPQTRLSEAWEWHAQSKALTARLGREGWIEHFTRLIASGWSWAISLDNQLAGLVVFEPTLLPGEDSPSDAQVHIAVARKHWGKGVIQKAAMDIIPASFRVMPTLRRLTAWTVGSNWPARSVAESLGFTLEGTLRHAVPGDDLLLFGLTREEVENGKWTQNHNN